jgi:hypothetical protein
MKYRLFCLLVLTIILGSSSCSSKPKATEAKREGVVHLIERMESSTLRVRRPETAPADPYADENVVGYEVFPPPDKKFDCKRASSLFTKMNLRLIRECLSTMHSSFTLSYFLRREDQPVLEIDGNLDKYPNCLVKHLSSVPVPREIFFKLQSKSGRNECYSARIPIEANKMLGFTIPVSSFTMNVEFPIKEALETDSDVIALLTGWAITPYFWMEREGAKGGQIPARVVTDSICRACYDDDATLREKPHPSGTVYPY